MLWVGRTRGGDGKFAGGGGPYVAESARGVLADRVSLRSQVDDPLAETLAFSRIELVGVSFLGDGLGLESPGIGVLRGGSSRTGLEPVG